LPQVGAEGKAFTSLHPGGKILIADDLYDALAEVGYIDKDEKVVVVKIQGSAIIVAKK
jgi:membrane-bound serine protease (ClpP class)